MKKILLYLRAMVNTLICMFTNWFPEKKEVVPDKKGNCVELYRYNYEQLMIHPKRTVNRNYMSHMDNPGLNCKMWMIRRQKKVVSLYNTNLIKSGRAPCRKRWKRCFLYIKIIFRHKISEELRRESKIVNVYEEKFIIMDM